MPKKIINVTKTYLPPLAKYEKYLKKIWENNWLTNNGPLTVKLENELKKYLGVKHLFLVSNGTIALEIAIKALDLNGEIITTPFSYVATTSSMVWVGCVPVFADIEPKTLNINPELIGKLITKKTKAILATHVYGNPCNVEEIQRIATMLNLKIIYDGAHCFNVKYGDKSVLNFGDISTLSFHATKLFHTAEGGAVITNDDETAHRISYLRNFGHRGPEDFYGLGINGKMSELHSAMGLCVLPEIKNIINRRKEISSFYDSLLSSEKIQRPLLNPDATYNFAYYPVIFDSEKSLLKVRKKLNEEGIFPRRYFYPSLNYLNYVKKYKLPVTDELVTKVLCLPMYHSLTRQEINKISTIINKSLSS